MNYSRQRQAIMDFLLTRRDHPTAEAIYTNVRNVLPNISLGTVYRNLNLLADTNAVRRIRGLNGAEHFDADVSDHQHFICRSCGMVGDIFLDDPQLLDAVRRQAEIFCTGHITESDIYFYGICQACTETLQGLENEISEKDRNPVSSVLK